MTLHTSRADVATETPARYAKQLVSHLGHKIAFSTEGDVSTAVFGTTTGSIIVGEGVLTLTAAGDDPEGVARVEQVMGGHLVRFGQRQELLVEWTRTSADQVGHGA
jgi:uncharacterized protein